MKHAHKVDMTFKYTKACETDVGATFKRIRKEQKAAEAAKVKPAGNVKALPAKKEKGRG